MCRSCLFLFRVQLKTHFDNRIAAYRELYRCGKIVRQDTSAPCR
nr:MAG TPA: hypothetical protein [Caudoviricetes sp.]